MEIAHLDLESDLGLWISVKNEVGKQDCGLLIVQKIFQIVDHVNKIVEKNYRLRRLWKKDCGSCKQDCGSCKQDCEF